MKTHFSKVMSALLAGIMLISSFSIFPGTTFAEDTENTTEKESYLIYTDNEKEYNKLAEKYSNYISEDSGVTDYLQENNILNLEISESQLKSIERKNDSATIEEDIVLKGSGDNTEVLYDEITQPVEQWNLDMIGAKNVSENTDHVKVAVIDTGVCASSQINVVDRINLMPEESEVDPLYEDVSGHGTSVASIIGAVDDGRSIRGVNPNAEIYSVKALSDGECAPLSRIIEGIYWCIDKDVDIINMSFGTHTDSPLLYQAVKTAADAGILMIAAAGNNKNDGVEYPAAYNEVIAVGSVDNNADISDFSAIGEAIELVAPGEEIAATGYFDEVVKTDGTSVSTAQVTGVASLLWEQNTNKSADFIRGLLTASAKSLGDEEVYGSGVVDAEYALAHYDEYEQKYSESDYENQIDVLNNNEDIITYTDDEVEALWWQKSHSGVIDSTSYSGDKKLLMKYAVKMSDVDLRGLINKKHNIAAGTDADKNASHYFHGYGNYIANYIFLARYAKAYYDGTAPTTNVNDSRWASLYPHDLTGEYGSFYNCLVNGLVDLNDTKTAYGWSYVYIKINRDTELGGSFSKNITQSKGHDAIILIGIAIHCAMDAYTHSAIVGNDIDGYSLYTSDNPNDLSVRYDTAKRVALDILTKWENRDEPGVDFQLSEFYQPNVHTNGSFYLNNLLTYALAIKPSLQTISQTKYDFFVSRNKDHSVLL